jgi:hypothetical protein
MSAYIVETYQLTASNGRPIRQATKVTCPDGKVIHFLEKLGKAQAIKQAAAYHQLRKQEIGQ